MSFVLSVLNSLSLTCFRESYRKYCTHFPCNACVPYRWFLWPYKANMKFSLNCFMPTAFISLSTHNWSERKTREKLLSNCVFVNGNGWFVAVTVAQCWAYQKCKLRNCVIVDISLILNRSLKCIVFVRCRNAVHNTCTVRPKRKTDLQCTMCTLTFSIVEPFSEEKLEPLILMPVHRMPSTRNVLFLFSGMVLPLFLNVFLLFWTKIVLLYQWVFRRVAVTFKTSLNNV